MGLNNKELAREFNKAGDEIWAIAKRYEEKDGYQALSRFLKRMAGEAHTEATLLRAGKSELY